MGQALYRSYRSKKLSEIVGQEHITDALSNALRNNTISHAYLFTGPRGVGKTSIARILAHDINGLVYENDRNHLDIIEIDAASNRRIDEIRDLRDKVHIAPTSATYKVYIIDEVHMLTKEAFNALLKTLEEPPAHVVFILATTEVHKLPETIISRTQRYAFKPVEQQKVIDHLRSIASSEKITISDEALTLIATHGEGSFRDSISLLDQVRNQGEAIELADVQSMLGIAPHEHITTIMTALGAHEALAVAEALKVMREQGYEPAQVARQLGAELRQAVISGISSLPHETAIKLLSALVQIHTSSDPRIALEIALIDAALVDVAIAPQKPTVTAAKPTAKPVAHESITTPAVIVDAVKPTTAHTVSMPAFAPGVSTTHPKKQLQSDAAAATEDTSGRTIDNELLLDDNIWHAILGELKKQHMTLYQTARIAEPHYQPGTLSLEFSQAFHIKRLKQAQNIQIIADTMQQIIGKEVAIAFVLGTGKPAPLAGSNTPLPPADGEIVHNAEAMPRPAKAINPLGASAPADSPFDTISNIFGGAEVLES